MQYMNISSREKTNNVDKQKMGLYCQIYLDNDKKIIVAKNEKMLSSGRCRKTIRFFVVISGNGGITRCNAIRKEEWKSRREIAKKRKRGRGSKKVRSKQTNKLIEKKK